MSLPLNILSDSIAAEALLGYVVCLLHYWNIFNIEIADINVLLTADCRASGPIVLSVLCQEDRKQMLELRGKSVSMIR